MNNLKALSWSLGRLRQIVWQNYSGFQKADLNERSPQHYLPAAVNRHLAHYYQNLDLLPSGQGLLGHPHLH